MDTIKRTFIRWMFNKYRKQFEDLFIADVFDEVPHDLTQNSMQFLLSGGTNFDRWMRISSYVLQRKLEQPRKEGSGTFVGGLIFFQTLNIMMSRLQHGKIMQSPEEVEIIPDVDLDKSLEGVDEFFKRSQK